jgi:hypothetical protein
VKQFLITLLAGILAMFILAVLASCDLPKGPQRPSQRAVDLAKSMVPEDPEPYCDSAANQAHEQRMWEAHQRAALPAPQK